MKFRIDSRGHDHEFGEHGETYELHESGALIVKTADGAPTLILGPAGWTALLVVEGDPVKPPSPRMGVPNATPNRFANLNTQDF